MKQRYQRRKAAKVGIICLWGLCLLAAQGCLVGPDFRKPQPKTPSEWHGLSPAEAPGKAAITAQRAELVQWWKNFNDPLLTSLVERAIVSNLDLRQAEARIKQARAAVGVVSAGFWPVVDVSGQYQRSQTSANSSSGFAFNFFRTGLDASWELDFFGGTRRNIEASQADLEAAVMDSRDVFVTLIAEVGANYTNLRQFQKQIEIAKRNLEAQKHTANITRKRHEAGYVGGLDVANAQAQVAATASLIPVLQTSVMNSIFNLGLLLGMEPAALEDELSVDRMIPPAPPVIPVGIPSDLLRRRPDVRRAEAQIHAATARIGVATADLFPKFSLTGSAGFSSTKANTLFEWGSRYWSWGPAATWPIFDAGRIRWNIEVQNAIQEQTLLAYEKTVLTALKDVETALVAYSNELEHHRLLEEAVANNKRAVDLSTKLYVEGKTDFLNVLNAQRSLYISEEALVQSTNALTLDIISLYKALGGGWEKTEGGNN